jgi:hypothetical protein
MSTSSHTAGPTHLCKTVFRHKLKVLQMPSAFIKYLVAVPEQFSPTTNNDCTWKVMNDRLTLDKGWAELCVAHDIRIGSLLTFKLVGPTNLRVLVFNGQSIQVVANCLPHHKAFDIDAEGNDEGAATADIVAGAVEDGVVGVVDGA